jgi:hypothetical protein
MYAMTNVTGQTRLLLSSDDLTDITTSQQMKVFKIIRSEEHAFGPVLPVWARALDVLVGATGLTLNGARPVGVHVCSWMF